MLIRRFFENSRSFRKDFNIFLSQRNVTQRSVDKRVKRILDDVKKTGDLAVKKYTAQFDKHKINSNDLRISKSRIKSAYKYTDKELVKSLRLSAKRIEIFHKKQLPKNSFYEDSLGVRFNVIWNPIDSIGLYVPGGSVSYPSSVLMNGIPAKVAGVERTVMTVPFYKGKVNPSILVAADIAGIDEIYQVGGAQAIGALAFGTKKIRSVDKICGPGNIYVSSAKKQVFGTVGIDFVAGPSEVLIVADSKNDPKVIAADLISQAEHDRNSQCILISTSENFSDLVENEIKNYLTFLPRAKIIRASLFNYGAVIIVKNFSKVPTLINKIAPEHVELAAKKSRKYQNQINNAGIVFLGENTPEVLGDYILGTNHVLPTLGTAKFNSGLSTPDYMKKTFKVECGKKALKKLSKAAIKIAEAEGLDAHAQSLKARDTKR